MDDFDLRNFIGVSAGKLQAQGEISDGIVLKGNTIEVKPWVELETYIVLDVSQCPADEELKIHINLHKYAYSQIMLRGAGDQQNMKLKLMIELAEASQLYFASVFDNKKTDASCKQTIEVKQYRDSQFFHHQQTHEGRVSTQNKINVRLLGPGALCVLNGLYRVNGEQQAHHDIEIIHQSPNTHSEQLYRGVLDGKARASFRGKVIVAEKAQHITADQSNRNILLSETAVVETKPELEIYADDVKCSHGATVGQLDQEALFYLRSRGISEVKAKNMLLKGFLEEVIMRADKDLEVPQRASMVEEAKYATRH